jgi:hypothetical protein
MAGWPNSDSSLKDLSIKMPSKKRGASNLVAVKPRLVLRTMGYACIQVNLNDPGSLNRKNFPQCLKIKTGARVSKRHPLQKTH